MFFFKGFMHQKKKKNTEYLSVLFKTYFINLLNISTAVLKYVQLITNAVSNCILLVVRDAYFNIFTTYFNK